MGFSLWWWKCSGTSQWWRLHNIVNTVNPVNNKFYVYFATIILKSGLSNGKMRTCPQTMFSFSISSSTKMVLRPARGFLCLFWRQRSRAHLGDGVWTLQGSQVTSLAGASYIGNLYSARAPSSLKKHILQTEAGYLPLMVRQARWQLPMEAGYRGRGFSSWSCVTGFNGSTNCGIRELSSCFICSKPSL